MRIFLLLALALSGCPEKPRAPEENSNPYHNVTPQKMKDKVEAIQKQEDERNDKRLEEMK